MNEPRYGSVVPQSYGAASREPANLGDILERVLDKGIVIAGDIRVNLLDIELLTIKLRLLIVSVETARELGIDWWEHDPWLTGGGDRHELEEENRRLRDRIAAMEDDRRRPVVEARHDEEPPRRRSAEPYEEQEPPRRRSAEYSRDEEPPTRRADRPSERRRD